MLAARHLPFLITARARKIKPIARMLANARKQDHSIRAIFVLYYNYIVSISNSSGPNGVKYQGEFGRVFSN